MASVTFTNLPRLQGVLRTISSRRSVSSEKKLKAYEVGMSRKKQAGGQMSQTALNWYCWTENHDAWVPDKVKDFCLLRSKNLLKR